MTYTMTYTMTLFDSDIEFNTCSGGDFELNILERQMLVKMSMEMLVSMVSHFCRN